MRDDLESSAAELDVSGDHGAGVFQRVVIACLTPVVALLVLILAEVGARSLVATEMPARSISTDTVTELPKSADKLPLTLESDAVLLIGNSHTYALPGLAPGDCMRKEEGRTLAYELARRLDCGRGSDKVDVIRLSYPNFNAVEILIRVAQLLRVGMKPRSVVLGLTWRNIARDASVRHSVRLALRDPEFTEWLVDWLKERRRSTVADAIASEVQATRHEREQERTRSHADDWDVALSAALGDNIALIGQSPALRAAIYRELAYLIERTLVPTGKAAQTYDTIEEELRTNLDALTLVLELLAEHGISGVVYRAPRRPDLPPLGDPVRGIVELGKLEDTARGFGFTTVDCTDLVPPELWGWERHTPDRSHFTEPGHVLLAEAIVEAGIGARVLCGARP